MRVCVCVYMRERERERKRERESISFAYCSINVMLFWCQLKDRQKYLINKTKRYQSSDILINFHTKTKKNSIIYNFEI